jgi:PAS domain S-box-containing protein
MSDRNSTKAFIRSKAGKGYFVYICFCALLSVGIGCGLYYMSLNWFKQAKSEEKITALQLVDAFVADYSDNRGKYLSGDAPVPATFRAHAIERFNRIRETASTLRLVMVGPPGLEIATAPLDADMAQSIERFREQPSPKPETGFVTLNGDVFFRTAYPSLASQQSCVDCHNKLQAGKHQWKLNDVLGAFVVDVPAGPFLHGSKVQAAELGGGIFGLLAAVGLYISLLHFRQIAERESAQGRIELSEERFRDFAETASDWFWEQDETLRFSYLSNAVLDKSGMAVDAHIGKTRREVVKLGVTEEQWLAHEAGLAARQPFKDFQFQRLHSDGTLRHISISGRPFFAADGRFLGYRGSARDITTIVAVESELERRVEERSSELRTVQEELIRKERLATLGQLTATVSHELRNPLGVIRNTMFTVVEAANGNGLKLERAFSRIERSIGRCDSIITELLDYTRSRDLSRQDVAIDTWLGEVLDEQKVSDKIAVVRDFGAVDHAVSIDPDRFRRVIINLVDNAAQAIEGDRGRVGSDASITVRSRVGADRIEIEIADTGPGIPPDVFARIFEPLFSTKGFGVGLGLPLVKQIVEHHGGSIEIATVVGQGTRALVRLPLAQAKAKAKDIAA